MNVLVTPRFTDAQLARIRAAGPGIRVTREDADRADYSEVDVLYTVIPPRDLSRVPRLKWLQVHMAGTDALHEHPIYTESRLPLATSSGVHAATIAEYAITTLLALAHRVPRMVEWKARGGWPPDKQRWPLFVPTEVRGATLGVIGYGSIGRELARIAKTAFAMTVLACKRDPSRRRDDGYCVPGTGDPEGALPDAWFTPAQLRELLARSDVVVMCAPLTRETRHMIGAGELSAMKPTAYFINTGRGPTHNEADLIRALKEGKMAGAGLDVMELEPTQPDNPLHKMENVVLTPHTASVSDWANVERRRRVGQDIAAVLQGRMPRAVVNKEVLAKVNLAEPVRA